MATTIILEIRERLRTAIVSSNLKQCEIAEKLSIAAASVSLYMIGRNLPSLDTLSKLCKILNVSADYILCLTDDPTPRLNHNP